MVRPNGVPVLRSLPFRLAAPAPIVLFWNFLNGACLSLILYYLIMRGSRLVPSSFSFFSSVGDPGMFFVTPPESQPVMPPLVRVSVTEGSRWLSGCGRDAPIFPMCPLLPGIGTTGRERRGDAWRMVNFSVDDTIFLVLVCCVFPGMLRCLLFLHSGYQRPSRISCRIHVHGARYGSYWNQFTSLRLMYSF